MQISLTKKVNISFCGQAIHTLKQNPLDGKKCGNGCRLKYFLTAYLDGVEYKDCIVPDSNTINEILEMKTKTLQDSSYAEELIKWFEVIKTLKVVHPRLEKDGPEINSEKINRWMEEGARKLVEKRSGVKADFL